jgi:poly(hydroxyalkanoate) depolymerase family esterase
MNFKFPAGFLRATRFVRKRRFLRATAALHRAVDAYLGPRPRGRFRPTEPAAPVPGRFVTGSYANRAGRREYTVYIPALYHGQALPLIVMLHGCKQNPQDFAAGTRMNTLAEERGCVVVYPRQPRKANPSCCWNWFEPQHQQRDKGEPSLIAGVTREVIATYQLDEDRVFVAGLSAGGAMAAIMGTTYPDLYAAVGIHSGLAYASAYDVSSAFAVMRGEESTRSGAGQPASVRLVPTIVFHGDRDSTVHPTNGERVVARVSNEHAGSEDPDVVSENGAANGRTYTRTVRRDIDGSALTEHWLVHGASHAWSGGSAAGSYADVEGPDASREMLRFFLERSARRIK